MSKFVVLMYQIVKVVDWSGRFHKNTCFYVASAQAVRRTGEAGKGKKVLRIPVSVGLVGVVAVYLGILGFVGGCS